MTAQPPEPSSTKKLVNEMIANGYLAPLKDLVRLCYNPAHKLANINSAALCGAGLIDIKTRQPTCPDEIKMLLTFRDERVFLGGCEVAKASELCGSPTTTVTASDLVTEPYKFGRVR